MYCYGSAQNAATKLNYVKSNNLVSMEVLQYSPGSYIISPYFKKASHFKIILRKRCWLKSLQISPPTLLRVEWSSRALGWTHASSSLPACSKDPKLHHHVWIHLPPPQKQHTQTCSGYSPWGRTASRQPGLWAAGCCRQKSLATGAQTFTSFPDKDQAPPPSWTFSLGNPRRVTPKRERFIATKLWNNNNNPKCQGLYFWVTSVKNYIFKSQGLFVAFWHTACWNCAYQGLWSISDSAKAFQQALCSYLSFHPCWPFTWATFSNNDLPLLI